MSSISATRPDRHHLRDLVILLDRVQQEADDRDPHNENCQRRQHRHGLKPQQPPFALWEATIAMPNGKRFAAND